MTDDISEVVNNAQCYVINSATSLYAYRNNIRYSYSQIGGKWYQNGQTTYSSVPSGSTCVNRSVVESLSSNAHMLPIYYMIAFVLAIFVWFICFKIWSVLIKWRG